MLITTMALDVIEEHTRDNDGGQFLLLATIQG